MTANISSNRLISRIYTDHLQICKNQRQPSNLKMSKRLEQAFRRFPSVGENSALHTRVPQKARTTVFTQHNQLQPQGRRNPNVRRQKDDKLWYRKDAILWSKKGSKLQLRASWVHVINCKVRHERPRLRLHVYQVQKEADPVSAVGGPGVVALGRNVEK